MADEGRQTPDIRFEIDPTWEYIDEWRTSRFIVSRFTGVQSSVAPQLEVETEMSFTFSSGYEGGFQESAETNWVTTEIVGRVEGYVTWIANGNRVFTVPLTLQARGVEHQVRRADVRAVAEFEVLRPAKWMEALRYPMILPSGRQVSPPPVILTVGGFYRGRGVIQSASITWQPPFHAEGDRGSLPLAAEVEVEFQETTLNPGQFDLSPAPVRVNARRPENQGATVGNVITRSITSETDLG